MNIIRTKRNRAKKIICPSVRPKKVSGPDQGLSAIRSKAKDRINHGNNIGKLSLRLEVTKDRLLILVWYAIKYMGCE
jgi:hypothetical protein